MEKTVHELGVLLQKTVPTFVLVGLLYLYLKRMFFGPLERVLGARRRWSGRPRARERRSPSAS